jgi:hypothetical protein
MTFTNQLISNGHIFAAGVMDSVSFHKLLPILTNCQSVAKFTGLCLGANLFLLVGSSFIYSSGISPAINYLSNSSGIEVSVASSLANMFYHTNWLVPMLVLCYVSGAGWYQNIADAAFEHLGMEAKEKSIKSAATEGTYALAAWLVFFGLVQLLTGIGPMILSILIWVIKSIVYVFLLNIPLIKNTLVCPLYALSFLSQAAGTLLMAELYGWYGFDYYWTACGYDTKKKFSIMQKNWAYFLGFGAPYVLVIKFSSFFVGLGIYFAAFPFCILLAMHADYEQIYKEQTVMPDPLPFLDPVQQATDTALKLIDDKVTKSPLFSKKQSKKVD